MESRQMLQNARSSYNVAIRQDHKQKMLLARRLRIIKFQEEQSATSESITKLESALREGLQTANWQLLEGSMQQLRNSLATKSEAQREGIACSDIPSLLCRSCRQAIAMKPAEAASLGKHLLYVFNELLASGIVCSPSMLPDIKCLVSLLGTYLPSSSNQDFEKIGSILAQAMLDPNVLSEVMQANIPVAMLARARSDRDVINETVVACLKVLLYNPDAADLLRQHPQMAEHMMQEAMLVMLNTPEFREDSDGLGDALSVVLQLVKRGVPCLYSKKLFVDLLGASARNRRNTLKIINIIEQFVYQNDAYALELAIKTPLLTFILGFLKQSNQEIRLHSADLLCNLSLLRPLTQIMSLIMEEIMKHMLIEDSELIRGKYFMALSNWAENVNFNFQPGQLKLMEYIRTLSAPFFNLDFELIFWKKVHEATKLPPPDYVLNSLSQEQGRQLFHVEYSH